MTEEGESSLEGPSPSSRYELYPVDIVYHSNRKTGEYCVYVFAKHVGGGMDSPDRRRLVVVEVTGWMPYMFLKVKDDDVEKMERTVLEFLEQARAKVNFRARFSHNINSSSDLKFIDGYGYRPDDAKERFMKVFVSDPGVYKKFAEIVPYKVYMAQVDPVCQFKIDVGLAHPSKLLCLAPKILQYDGPNGSLRMSTSFRDLEVIDNKSKETPALKAMSIHIKCTSESRAFPKAENMGDQIIQIASVTTSDMLRARHDNAHFDKCVFVVGSCDSVEDVDVRCYDSETRMLEEFRKHVVSTDPDIITGYKVRSFDWPYILDRFRLFKRFNIWPSFSRRRDSGNWSYYSRTDKDIVCSHDRILIDMCDVIKTERKLRSDSLHSVVAEFLPDEAPLDDLKRSEIKKVDEGPLTTTTSIARCSVTRALIPLKLMMKFKTAMSILELSNITGVPMRYIYDRGQQVRVMTLIAREAYSRQTLFPAMTVGATEQPDSLNDDGNDSSTDSSDGEEENKAQPSSSRKRKAESSNSGDVRYQGAKVVEPKIGYYDDPVCTLDFASLYPSVIIAMNLCYSTLRLQNSKRQRVDAQKEGKKDREDDGDCYKYAQGKPSPAGDEFVPEIVRKGILPTILEGLLKSRKQVKEEMEERKDDPFMWSVLNERQLAIKKCANSVYGFTGTKENGLLSCVEIARSVTAYGRTLLNKTIDYVEKFAQHTVIYGDTDSVMILCRGKTVAEAMNMGEILAERISDLFPHPIRLEFEKVYRPYILVGKKRYAGAMYSANPESHDKIDIKGLDTVRRNCTLYVSRITKDCIQDIIEKGNIDAAVERARKAVDDLLSGGVDAAELILYRTHAKKKYKSAQAHLCVVDKRIARGGEPAKVGDRIPYVICKEWVTDEEELQKQRKDRPHEFAEGENRAVQRKVAYRAEDPDYVKEKGLSIDYAYYECKQLKRPLLRLFGPVLGGEKKAASKIWPTNN